jgi:hypothetical protein
MNNTLERRLTEYEIDLPHGPLEHFEGEDGAVSSPLADIRRRELRQGYQRYIALIITVVALVYFLSR